ncbi:putative cellulose synthase (UDP-forming) [Helianthus debilis subsp. tardiflorus]
MYEDMKSRVEGVVQSGGLSLDRVMEPEFQDVFRKWTADFTSRQHPTVIQILLDNNADKDIAGGVMPNLIYVSREKNNHTPHNFKAVHLTSWYSIGFRYGTITEDIYTSFRLHCEGWKSVLCNPKRAAFLGGSPSNLNDGLTQIKRWYMGFLEIFFNKYCPLIYGVRSMNPLQALCYTHYTLRSFWSIPIIIYAFLPQVSLINSVSIFTKVSEYGFFLYVFLFLGAYIKDFLDFVVFTGGSTIRWWNHQRMWLIWGLSSYPFALLEWSLKCFGLSTFGFNVTSKVVDEEQNRLYEQGVVEFGVESVLFLPISVASVVNLWAFVKGIMDVLIYGRLEEFFVQIFISGFVVVNSWVIYEGMVLRKDRGKMPLKITLASIATAMAIYLLSTLIMFP